MSRAGERLFIAGEAGRMETVIDRPDRAPRGIALVAHPHPLYGGTLDNKVVQTLAKTFVELGYVSLRPNFRGVGASEGVHDEGRGETEDLLRVVAQAGRDFGDLPLVLAGFSFGASATMASVVTRRPATEEASCSAVRTTLAGSMMPLPTMSTYSSVCASKPKVSDFESMILPTTIEPSTPAFSAI